MNKLKFELSGSKNLINYLLMQVPRNLEDDQLYEWFLNNVRDFYKDDINKTISDYQSWEGEDVTDCDKLEMELLEWLELEFKNDICKAVEEVLSWRDDE